MQVENKAQEDTAIQDDIDYKSLYHIMNRRRKVEFRVLKDTYNAFIELYVLLIERDQYSSRYEKNVRSDAMSFLNDLYDQFLDTDCQIEDNVLNQILTVVIKEYEEEHPEFVTRLNNRIENASK